MTETEDVRAEVFADVAATLNWHADVWQEDGSDPCRVRICREFANAYRTYAEGVGVPSIDNLRRKRNEAEAALARVRALAEDERRHLVRWIDGSHLIDLDLLLAALDGKP